MAVRDRGELIAASAQQRFHCTAEFLAVLQGAGRLAGDAPPLADMREIIQILAADQFAQIKCQRADACGLAGVGDIAFQCMPVVFHHQSAAAGGHHDGFRTLFDMRPPCIDIAAHHGARAIRIGHMLVECAAATRTFSRNQRNAQFIQYTRRCRIGVGCGQRLDAAFEHQHAPRVGSGRRGCNPLCGGNF